MEHPPPKKKRAAKSRSRPLKRPRAYRSHASNPQAICACTSAILIASADGTAAPTRQKLSHDVETAVEQARFAEAIALLNAASADSPPLNLLRARALYGLERFPAAMNEVNALLDGKLDDTLRLRARASASALDGRDVAKTEDALATAIDLARDADDAERARASSGCAHRRGLALWTNALSSARGGANCPRA